MREQWLAQASLLPSRLGPHIVLSLAALALASTISLPLGVVASRHRWLRAVALSVVGVAQTVPGLALLALMVLLLGGFGFWPALSALTLYGILPVLSNTVAGMQAVPSDVREASEGLGMTPRQMLWHVELPLALPLILAGVRTASVWVVGTATLSTPVGQASLGNYIFSGLQTRNWVSVLSGCLAAALLALVLDGLLAWSTRAVRERRKAPVLLSSAGLLGLALAGLLLTQERTLLSPEIEGAPQPSETAAPGAAGPLPSTPPTLAVGAKTFTEQYILAELLALQLEGAGVTVRHVSSLGSALAFDALAHGDIDVYVDYTGTLYANVLHQSDVQTAERVRTLCRQELQRRYGVELLGALGFENAYALAMRADRAEQLGITQISDLASLSPKLRLGGDYEFFDRPEWKHLRSIYNLRFAEHVSMDSTFMYEAARRGNVDVITAFSSDGRIDSHGLVLLKDDRQGFPPYEAVILLSRAAADDARVRRALRPLLGAISGSLMRQTNLLVDRDNNKQTPAQAAQSLLLQVPAR